MDADEKKRRKLREKKMNALEKVEGNVIVKDGRGYKTVPLEDIPIEERSNYVVMMRFGEEPVYVPRYGKGGVYDITDRGEPGEVVGDVNVQRRMNRLLRWYMTPKVETIEELTDRCVCFFKECALMNDPPTYEKFCLSLGVTTTQMGEWRKGFSVSDRWKCQVNLAVQLISALEGERASAGEIAANVYMFRARNFLNMSDKVEISINTNNHLGDTEDESTLAKRLLESTTVINTEVIKDKIVDMQKPEGSDSYQVKSKVDFEP